MKSKQPFKLEQLMRWFGPSDPATLENIAQAGASGVVSALHHIPVGTIWEKEEIRNYQQTIERYKLNWTVVESLPVHEDIKTQSGQFEEYIHNYQQSLRNLAVCGIKVVTYNFMPVLDWVRTEIAHQLPDKAETSLFNHTDFAVADLFLLKRPNAIKDYSPAAIAHYEITFRSMSEEKKQKLLKNVLLGLPGSDVPFTLEQVFQLLQQYQNIDRNQLQHNLIAFLKAITPTAEEVGIQLAIHPDDPPFSVLGLPRIMSTEQDIADMMQAVPSKANGLCFCTGSFGARADNDLLTMLKKWSSRVYFLHLRNTRRDESGNFIEAPHLEGDTDMYALLREILLTMQREQRSIPMRPDHGYKILDDLNKKVYPGYSVIGRLKGLAELRGLEYGILRGMG